MPLQEKNNDIVGFSALICLVLVGFKLAGSIIAVDWSWWWVFSPVWIYAALSGIFYCISVIQKFNRQISNPQNRIEENALDFRKRSQF
ncbi:MAG: hypothetical protein PSX81_00885 [bacterium]|nr:hypothetical protein [bacterium]